MANSVKKPKGFVKTYVSGIIRAFMVAVLLILQFGLIFALAFKVRTFGVWIYYAIEVGMSVVILCLLNRRANNSFKFGWLFIIAVVPVGGFLMYLLWGRERSTNRIRLKSMELLAYGNRYEECNNAAFEHLDAMYPDFSKSARYMQKNHFSLYEGNAFEYYSSGEDAFEAVICDMKAATKFIFLSFFIVADGELWNRVKPVLLERVSKGVEIKFMYDDFGSMFRTDNRFWQELTNAGIEVSCFNPITKYMDKLYLNYRSHQKMIVIDGNIGYTGGFNLADEYVNEVVRFGHWKDGGVRIEGPGVFGMTTTFLNMWGMNARRNEMDYFKYKPTIGAMKDGGFVQFISDGPENNPANPIASTILQLIYTAKDYLYITTPYLLLEDDMSDALIQAAQSGVDVRLITPAIPDKKFVYLLTQYNYGKLLSGGVRIFEYVPGFIHAKNIITGDVGIIGTINLDNRSLYLHYECGAFMYDKELIEKVKADLLETFECSDEVSYEEWLGRPWWDKVRQWIFNIFSGLV